MASHAILHNSLEGLHALLLVLPALLLALVHEVGLHKGCLADLHECGPDGKHLWEPSSAGKAGECARGLEQWQSLPGASDEDFVAPRGKPRKKQPLWGCEGQILEANGQIFGEKSPFQKGVS